MEPTDSDFMRELMTVFCGEAEERLTTIDQRLLAIEQSADTTARADLLADLMRELHTLKGSAGAVNLPDVSRLAHALETHFGELMHPGAQLPAIVDRGYRGLDVMRALIELGSRGERSDSDVDAAIAALRGTVHAPPTEASNDAAAQVAHVQGVVGAASALGAPVDETPAAANATVDVSRRPDDLAGIGHSPVAEPQTSTATAAVPWMGPEPPLAPAHAAPVQTVAPAFGAPGGEPAVAAAAQMPPAARGRRNDGPDDVVRLSTAKLDSLMARVGELVVTRIGTGRRTEEVRTLQDAVAGWDDAWRRVRPHVAKVAAAARDEGGTSLTELISELQRLLPIFEDGDARLTDISRQVGDLRSGIEADERRLTQVTADIENEVRRTRMLSVSSAFDPMHRLVRDLARDLGKEVILEVEGGETEVDRSVLEHIRSPLTHLIRNAVDHGIESPDVRETLGKPRRATIRLAATQRGGSLMLAIADDGSGIDADAIREAAGRLGIVTHDQLRIMSERDILRLIFRQSFSTSGAVTDISGRGVGLDVVRETVERLNGMVDVASEPGAGTTFTLSLPLSVATTQALLVEVSGMTYALPIGAVSRIVAADRDEIGRAQGREMIVLEDGPVVLVRLEDVLQLTSDEDHTTARRPVIVLGSDERRLGIAVDALIGTQDVVVKPLPRPLERVRHVAGATVLASGEVVVVLNTSDLVRSAVRTAVRVERILERPGSNAAASASTGALGSGSVMVVDDSIVTRMLEKSILEAAGYSVHVAADGVEAIRALHVTPVDVVVSDVNMPNMDGLMLTQQIRADAQLRHVPIVLVTSLDSPDDQVRGMEAGADAYIVKSSFSQEGLLETVARLITIQRSRND